MFNGKTLYFNNNRFMCLIDLYCIIFILYNKYSFIIVIIEVFGLEVKNIMILVTIIAI